MTDDAPSDRGAGPGATPQPPFFADASGTPRPAGSATPAAPFFPAGGPEAEPRPGVPPASTAASPQAEARAEPGEAESFPDDIFFVPEGAAPPVSSGQGDEAGMRAARREADRDELAEALALRLERLAERLRAEGRGALVDRLDSEDRLEALLAAVLAGAIAGHG